MRHCCIIPAVAERTEARVECYVGHPYAKRAQGGIDEADIAVEGLEAAVGGVGAAYADASVQLP